MIILFVSTYRDLVNQGKQLMDLKDEYDTYVLIYKKIFEEYKAIKIAGSPGATQDVLVSPEKESNAFDVVNRNVRYLAASACDFGKSYNLEDSLRYLYGIDGSRYEITRQQNIKKKKRAQG